MASRLRRLDRRTLGPPQPAQVLPENDRRPNDLLIWTARIGTLAVIASTVVALAVPSVRGLAAIVPTLSMLAMLWIARVMARDARKDFGTWFSLIGAGGFGAVAGWCWGLVSLAASQILPALVLGLLGARMAWIVYRRVPSF